MPNPSASESQLEDLPEVVREVLKDFVESAKSSLGEDLKSVVLFGSAAEGRLRATSDVNLLLVIEDFRSIQVDGLREKLRVAHAAIQLNVMFLKVSEIPVSIEAFAVKFTDILNRRRVLYGSDVFESVKIPRAATVRRLEQVIINLTLRLRERYALVSLREERLAAVVAEVTGPIRACAATILGLEGRSAPSPKVALEILGRQLSGPSCDGLLSTLSMAREERELPPGGSASAVLGLLDLLQAMSKHVQGLA